MRWPDPNTPKGQALQRVVIQLMDDRHMYGHYRNKVMGHMRRGDWGMAIKYLKKGGADITCFTAAAALLE